MISSACTFQESMGRTTCLGLLMPLALILFVSPKDYSFDDHGQQNCMYNTSGLLCHCKNYNKKMFVFYIIYMHMQKQLGTDIIFFTVNKKYSLYTTEYVSISKITQST